MKKGIKILIICAIILALVILGGFLYLYFNGYSGVDHHGRAEEGQIKVACVGDSITYGHGITNWPKNNYPRLLGDMLGDGYCVNNYGHHGGTLQSTGDQPYVSYVEYSDSLNFKADILVFMLGSNDAKEENWHGEEAFKAEYLARLSEYKADNPDIKIILCTPPKSYRENSQNPERADKIAAVVREISLEEGYELIDINNLTADRKDLYLNDNVHLNNDGAAYLAEVVYNALSGRAARISK